MNLEDFALGEIHDWSSLVLVRVHREIPYLGADNETKTKIEPIGYVFVLDPKFGSRAQWKLPAGHKKDGETPLDTAMRELAGETNLAPKLENFRYAGKFLGWRQDHWKCFFTADVEERELGWMNDQHGENEGEQPKFFTTAEFHQCVRDGKFMQEHFAKLVELTLILPGLELEASLRQSA